LEATPQLEKQRENQSMALLGDKLKKNSINLKRELNLGIDLYSQSYLTFGGMDAHIYA